MAQTCLSHRLVKAYASIKKKSLAVANALHVSEMLFFFPATTMSGEATQCIQIC